tara:strand:+ start:1156 stop:1260 length:105 start_codon:yes stop_codon:yes gene_type:complete
MTEVNRYGKTVYMEFDNEVNAKEFIKLWRDMIRK